MTDRTDTVETMRRNWRSYYNPTEVANARRKKLASVADFQIEANAAVKRGRQIMSGVSPEQIRGRETMRQIKAAQAGKRGERTFPPARSVVR